MISVIIETRDDEVALAHALAALVPAATEGVVREVIVVDRGSKDGTLVVADAAGCLIVRAADEHALHRVAEEARSEWLLFLAPSVILVPGWQAEALAFIDCALTAGKARASVAVVRRGRVEQGWLARLKSLLGTSQGRLIARSAFLAATSPSPSSSGASRVSGARRGAA
jgi:hypothetical protein